MRTWEAYCRYQHIMGKTQTEAKKRGKTQEKNTEENEFSLELTIVGKWDHGTAPCKAIPPPGSKGEEDRVLKYESKVSMLENSLEIIIMLMEPTKARLREVPTFTKKHQLLSIDRKRYQAG